MKYELDKQDIQNLSVFLNRVELKGNEATALVLLLQKLNKPIVEVPETPAKKEKKK